MAATGVWLLRDAHDQWLASYDAASGTRGGPEHHRALAMRLHQHAASVVTWARALDDLCNGEPVPLDTYRRARGPAEAELLDGARYACQRSVHQLLNLTRTVSGLIGAWSGPLVADNVAGVEWADEHDLPAAVSEFPGQAPLRAAYIARYAGRPIFGTLADLRTWFDQQLP